MSVNHICLLKKSLHKSLNLLAFLKATDYCLTGEYYPSLIMRQEVQKYEVHTVHATS